MCAGETKYWVTKVRRYIESEISRRWWFMDGSAKVGNSRMRSDEPRKDQE